MKRNLIPILGILLLAGCRHATSPNSDDGSKRPAGRKYSVTIAGAENGKIVAKPASAYAGTRIMLQVSPDEGYKLSPDSLIVKGLPLGDTNLGETVRSFILPRGNVTVSGKFEALSEKIYSVSPVLDTDKGGIIIPEPQFGPTGTAVHLSVIPDDGYRYVPGSLKADGIVVDELTRTLSLPDHNIKVSANFERLPSETFTVRVSNSDNGYIFARPESGKEGAEIYLQVIAKPGYGLKTGSLKYTTDDSEEEKAVNESLRTILMPKGHILVYGEFEKVPDDNYSIGIENTVHGRIFTESKYGTLGTKITVQVYPDPGYIFKEGSLVYKTSSGTADINSSDMSFEMPADNIIISGEFVALEKDSYSVQVGKFSHGKITPFPEFGKKDTNIFLRIKADIGYQLKPGSLFYVDDAGTAHAVPDGSAFILPASHVKIKAEFEPLSANIYSVQASDEVVNGHIIAIPGSGKESSPVSLWVMPDSGYYYKKGTLKYKLVPSNAQFQVSDETRAFKLNASNVQVLAEFVKIPSNNLTIQVAPTEHGMIYPRQDYGNPGQRIDMIVLPDPGYQLKPGTLQYKDANNVIKKFNNNDTNFHLPREHVIVSGEFEAVKYTANVDSSISNGSITINPQQAIIDTVISLEITPKNGYRLVPNSLKYKSARANKETAINEQTRSFPMPPEDVVIMAKFEPYNPLGDLKVNGRPLKGVTGGKTDYMVWIPQQEEKAEITFDAMDGVSVSPGSGETISLDPLEKKDVVFAITTKDGKVKTNYTISVIREFIPTKEVPAGSFQRSTNINDISYLSAFRMGEREVTQEEWNKVMGFERGKEGAAMPAHNISWYEAVVFCNKLSVLEGKTPAYVVNNTTDTTKWGKVPDLVDNFSWNVSCKWEADGYRLPTEMEWHWAAMGADTKLSGRTNTSGYNYDFAGITPDLSAEDAAWYKDNSGGKIHPVGEKKPNELGLYDMSGNVMEWCWDWVYNNYQKTYGMGGKQTNFRGGDNNTDKKMRRGGSYLSGTEALVLNYRGVESGKQEVPYALGDPRSNEEYVGLRIVYQN
jgi:formylglycine-generating enzyme required for sulfatase activity